ncbi:MAG: aminoacyl-tRNA hydrolase [Candidatus Poribacteria bacterium]
MKLIVGLGNPSEKYERTRHNVGFDIVDLFCHELGVKPNFRRDYHSRILEGQLESQSVILAKPQTYMNSSGRAVRAIAFNYDIPLEDIIVIYDDLNLELGLIRVRRGGSAGGHKGVKSIIESLGSEAFPRIRIGIGQPPQDMEIIDFVLSRFSSEERDEIEKVEQTAIEAIKVMIFEGIDNAMNKFNVRQKGN